MENAGVKRLLWRDVSHDVAQVNPALAEAINKISPGDNYHLYKISYPFGEKIIDQGALYLPAHDGVTKPISSSCFPKQIEKELISRQNGLPLGVVLNNSYELFTKNRGNVLPILKTNPGSVFSLWRRLDSVSHFHPSKLFNAVAGARNIFMLPNIGDNFFHKNLVKEFGVEKFPPKRQQDHWSIFKSIASKLKSPWRVEVIFFTNNWTNKIKTDPCWADLHRLLLTEAWGSSSYERNQSFYEFALYQALQDSNRSPSPYILDTIKHLISIVLGAAPGFAPAETNDLAPVELIQKVYIDTYNIDYVPTLMQPAHFSLLNPKAKPVYYFLQNPTTLRLSLKPSDRNVMEETRVLKYMTDIFFDKVKKNNIHLNDTVLGQMVNNINFNYFHSLVDKQGVLEHSAKISSVDKRFLTPSCTHKKLDFCHTAALLKGVTQIIHK